MINANPYSLGLHEILIFDDLVSSKIADNLENFFINESNWNIGLTTTGTSAFSNKTIEKFNLTKLYEQFQFGFPIIDRSHNLLNLTQSFFVLYPLINFSLKQGFVWDADNILRVKANLQTRAPKESKGKYNFPHVDINEPNLTEKITTILYYVNDSDGDTFFFKNQIKDIYGDPKNLDNLEIVKKVSPKKGRLVEFNGSRLHAGSHPIENELRIVVNYNILFNSLLGNGTNKNFEGLLFKDYFPNFTPA